MRYQPLGPVLAVMPWNFPFWQVFRFAAPALMAGNVVLLKHASNVPQCALAIEDIFRRAGFPEGAFQTLLIGSDQVQRILADPRVAGASLTGSERAGRSVAGAAGRHLKKMVLELGGSDPFIVMPSADIARGDRHGGQGARRQQRAVVHRRQALHRADAVAERFERGFTEQMRALKVGDPLDPATEVGPLATQDRAHGPRRSGAALGRGRRARADRRTRARSARATTTRRPC